MEPRPQSTNYFCGVYMRAASIRLRTIFVWRLFEGGVYFRAASISGNTVCMYNIHMSVSSMREKERERETSKRGGGTGSGLRVSNSSWPILGGTPGLLS